MIISRQTLRDGKPWIIFCILLLAGTHFTYQVHTARSIHGASGGNLHGLVYGAVGTAAILFAMLFMAKKTWRSLRIGRAYTWLQGHVWLGLVSYPIIWYHAGWRFGGPLTATLMWIFTAVWVSGILGLLLQNLVPHFLFDRVPDETIYDQIDRVGRENLKAARKLIRARMMVASLGVEGLGLASSADPKSGDGKAASDALREFYEATVRPYMAYGLSAGPASWGKPWRASWSTWLGPTPARRSARPTAKSFASMRSRYPGLFEQLNALEDLVQQRSQHRLQKRLHWALHGWLLLHVPLSVIMMFLIPLHAVLALRY